METTVRKFFERYERFFRQALGDEADMDEAASFYAGEFIAASPAGVAAGKNDDRLKQVMAQGYARYRMMGLKDMRVRHVDLSPMDELHCVGHVAWTATYVRQNQSAVAIDFDVHYFMQVLGGEPRIFGWVAGDEPALLEQHGIV
ncbi:hypothetical protein CDO44_00695 [Pigmentiphaga sp. NML080357]|uniref:hypothetical protein n=1 Tax=Pigmentiphaga sp. NML080357 TaxID=2008675 RepID=UPI000B41C273|nr:hypothetical protein [Pigmentiphaga sp. NML080357]OVZ64762.1 hypothetical protein CDO44_00695 [Pigmentiphaga sp. NML080357]